MVETRRPLLSLIMPVYKAEKYLRQSVDSILATDLRDLELLLIDDGSSDNSGNICDVYASQDSRVRVFHQKNQGVSAARNRGLAEARGIYVGFVDSDDWVDPDLHSQVLAYMQEKRLDACVFGLRMTYADHEKIFGTMPACRLSREDAIYEMFQGNHFQGWPWNKIYLRDLVTKHKFDERIHL